VSAQQPSAIHRALVRIGLALALLWTCVPLVWMLMSSFKPTSDLTASSPKFSFSPTLDHYRKLFSSGNDIGSYIVHSVYAAGVSTVISARTTSPSGSSRRAWPRSPPRSCRCS
jgi:multiple sugar transport system permease protein